MNKAYRDAQATIDANNTDDLKPVKLVEKVPTAFLGDRLVPLSYEATLPAIFREKIVTFPANLSITTLAQLVSAATGFPVHLSPDVYMSKDEFIPRASGGESRATAASLPRQSREEPIYRQPCSCAVGSYLRAVSDDLGLDWSFDGTTISMSRLVTRTFMIAAVPGKVSIKSDVTKGTDTTTGAQATGGSGATSSNNGSFSAMTKSSRSGEYDYMEAIKTELNDLKSPLGKIEVNPQSRLVMVHDTRENVQQMTLLLERENAISTRQVSLRVRTIQLVANDNSQAAFSTDVIFSQIQQGLAKYSVAFAAPTSLATAAGGSVGLSILKPNTPFSGTNAVLQGVNAYGKTVEDDVETKLTLNGVPVPIASYETKGYLASTSPSSGSLTGTSSGVPGLIPGSVTVGKFINMLPSVNDHNQILLSYWNDTSQLNGPFTTISVGSGATLQQIQLPDITGMRDDQTIALSDGQTIVLYGAVDNHFDSSTNGGIGGASGNWNKQRTFQIVMLTATVVPSM